MINTRAVRFARLGGPEVLRLEPLTLREPGPGEVRLRIDAIGLNRSEANFRRGRYLDKPRALPSGLGYEAAGEVEAVGPEVEDLVPGDAVSVLPTFPMSVYPQYGEHAIAPAAAVVRRPAGQTALDGAAVWMPFLTAYGGLIDVGGLKPGEHVIITAASSSVGLAAIAVARAVGAIPVVTTNAREKRGRLLEAGAAAVVEPDRQDLVGVVRDLSGGRGAAVAFDAVAGPGIEAVAAATALGGLVLVHGSLSGQPTPLPGLAAMRPVALRPYTLFEITGDADRLRRAKGFITAGLREGVLQPAIDEVFALDDVVAAHRRLESGAQFGKIMMSVAHDGAEATA